MADKTVVRSGGPSLGALVFLVFLILKLVGTIDWSWWWVTAPLWGPIVLCLGIALVGLVIWGITFMIMKMLSKKACRAIGMRPRR